MTLLASQSSRQLGRRLFQNRSQWPITHHHSHMPHTLSSYLRSSDSDSAHASAVRTLTRAIVYQMPTCASREHRRAVSHSWSCQACSPVLGSLWADIGPYLFCSFLWRGASSFSHHFSSGTCSCLERPFPHEAAWAGQHGHFCISSREVNLCHSASDSSRLAAMLFRLGSRSRRGSARDTLCRRFAWWDRPIFLLFNLSRSLVISKVLLFCL